MLKEMDKQTSGNSIIPHTTLFGDNCQIVKLANIIFGVENNAKLYIADIRFGDFFLRLC
jgi:hypothetical protein